MRILVVKITSMGDVLHLMPALTDFCQHYPDAEVDWMVESSFAEIPNWHPGVTRVIPAFTRKWRKLSLENIRSFFQFLSQLRSRRYDVVIDGQGLMKSAVFARFAKLEKNGIRAGYSAKSIKEKPAVIFYKRKIDVDRQQHAILRLRKLFAGVFSYSIDEKINYALNIAAVKPPKRQIMFFHGTTRKNKHLPDFYWRELAEIVSNNGYQVLLPWGNEVEKQRAMATAQDLENVTVLPKSHLTELAELLSESAGAIAVDTGLGHLAAALSVPTVSIYGPTDPNLIGALGDNQTHIKTPLEHPDVDLSVQDKSQYYLEVSPLQIWQKLQYLIN